MSNPSIDNPRMASEGLSNLANSIRRSVALYVAMEISDEDATMEQLLANADMLAQWLLGKAGAAADKPAAETFLGANPWERSTPPDT